MVKIFNKLFIQYACYIIQVVMDTDIITEEGMFHFCGRNQMVYLESYKVYFPFYNILFIADTKVSNCA